MIIWYKIFTLDKLDILWYHTLMSKKETKAEETKAVKCTCGKNHIEQVTVGTKVVTFECKTKLRLNWTRNSYVSRDAI